MLGRIKLLLGAVTTMVTFILVSPAFADNVGGAGALLMYVR